MILTDVMDEIGQALKEIEGLNVYPFTANRISVPAAMVGFPDPMTYDETMARGMDRFTVPVFVLVGTLDALASRNRLGKFLDGSGALSIKTIIEGGIYTACDSVRVMTAEVSGYTMAGANYLGAQFDIDVIGQGA